MTAHSEKTRSEALLRRESRTSWRRSARRSDYLAVAITERHGTPKGLIYYPLAQSSGEFPAEMDRKMPGVATAMPAIADVIGRHQPYKNEAIRNQNKLTREQKHNGLSLQMVRETYQCRVTEKATGDYIVWRGLFFTAEGFISEGGGTIDFGCNPHRDPPAVQPLHFTGGNTGMHVFGVPLDLSTQRPYPDAKLKVESGAIEEWWFVTPHRPVLLELESFQSAVKEVVADVASVADL
jgi:hypothetical protein